MSRVRRREPDSEAQAAFADAVVRLESLLQEMAQEGLTGIGFSALIKRDGTVSVASHALEETNSGAVSHLAACDLVRLPLRALVAFATRCARRCLPFALPFATTPDDAIAVDDALGQAEKLARGQQVYDSGRFSNLLEQLQGFAVDFPPAEGDASTLAGSHAAYAAFEACYGAYSALRADGEGATTRVQRVTFEASVAAAHAAEAALSLHADSLIGQVPRRLGASSVGKAMASDYRRLVELKLGEFPNMGEPIDPSEEGPLGSLWPEGVPDWYREGLASQGWQTVSQVRAEAESGARAKALTPSYARLKKLAEQSVPPREWFDEESKPF